MTREQVIAIFQTWADVVMPFATSPQMDTLLAALKADREAGKVILPDQSQIFRCFTETKLEDLRFVIIGQDPYPAKGLPDGLAFSTSPSNPTPRSLKLIYDAIHRDNGPTDQPRNNDLTYLTKQGGLLLNSSLTVVENTAGSHTAIWEPFITFLVTRLEEVTRGILWFGWGRDAQLILKNVNVFLHGHFLLFDEHPAAALYRAAAEKNPNPEWVVHCFSKANAIIRANKLGELIKW